MMDVNFKLCWRMRNVNCFGGHCLFLLHSVVYVGLLQEDPLILPIFDQDLIVGRVGNSCLCFAARKCLVAVST